LQSNFEISNDALDQTTAHSLQLPVDDSDAAGSVILCLQRKSSLKKTNPISYRNPCTADLTTQSNQVLPALWKPGQQRLYCEASIGITLC
jgi:hypothetical protein